MPRRRLLILFSLLGFATFVSIAGFVLVYLVVGRAPSVPSEATLVLRIGGDIGEVAPTDFVGYLRGGKAPTVRAIVDNLRKAKVDSRIQAIIVKPTGFQNAYWGKVQEIRDAILDFRKSGKPVYAYLENAGDREYYLATAADKIFLMPATPVDLTGVAMHQVFLRGTLDKLGLYPDLHHVGDFKTAPNTFTEKGYTPAHKAMDTALTGSLFDQLVKGIAEGRHKADADVRGLIDQGPFLPEEAVTAGLVDAVQYEDQARAAIRGSSNRRELEGEEYARIAPSSLGLDRGARIGLIYAAGTIAGGKSRFDPMNGAVVGSDTLIEAIRQARRDSSLKAIVVRIDSPGGSATASDAIWHELVRLRDEKPERPVVASMSDLAASGGYYIAMAAETIVAEPSTLTGSIGIFGGKLVTGGLYEKLGAHIESTTAGRHAGIDSPARPYTPEEGQKLDAQLRAFYDQFIAKVASSRHSTPQKIDQLAQGRVWTGHQAQQNGLVDELGGLERAIAIAKEKAKIPASSGVELVVFPPHKGFLDVVNDQFGGGAGDAAAAAWLRTNLSSAERELLQTMRSPLTLFQPGEVLALMPVLFTR